MINLKVTHNVQVRSLQLINHLLLIFGLIYVFYTGDYYLLGLSFLFYVITTLPGVNVGLHRLISHRSFKTTLIVERILSILSVFTTIGSPIAWAAIHRQHHRYCETERDPHSPYVNNKFNLKQALKVWFGFWSVPKLDLKLVRDLRKDKFQRWLHNNYLVVIVFYIIILGLIDPILIVFAYAIPSCMSLHSTSAIVVIAHKHGYKSYNLKNDESRNSWIAHLLSLGEGWHNNHHAKPWQWKQGEKWWEFDPPSWIIRIIKSG
jgi:fatty-acid desaturase